jgi:hypothetical protein
MAFEEMSTTRATRTSLGDVLLKPDIFKWLIAYIDGDDVRGVSLLDCAISDTQYLRPLFLHMLGSGELICKGLEFARSTIVYSEARKQHKRHYLAYMRWTITRNLTLRCAHLILRPEYGLDSRQQGDWARDWINRSCVHWEHVVVDSSRQQSINDWFRFILDENSCLSRLNSIDLRGTGSVVGKPGDFPFLADCPNVESVNIERHNSLDDVSVLAKCKYLKVLRLAECHKLSCISSLGQCPMLESVTISGCKGIIDVSALGPCQQLTRLSSVWGSRVDGISTLTKNLEVVELSCMTSPDMTTMGEFINLREISLLGGDADSIIPLAQCRQLESIWLHGLKRLENLAPLSECTHLKAFKVAFCDEITDISFVSTCAKLESVELRMCHDITDLTPLAHCGQLRTLKLVNCRSLADISFMSGCSKLETITIENCRSIMVPAAMVGLSGQLIRVIRE